MQSEIIVDLTFQNWVEFDAVITYNKRAKQFGIPIHDGGASWITINFCPWCATDIRNWDVSVVHREIAKEK